MCRAFHPGLPGRRSQATDSEIAARGHAIPIAALSAGKAREAAATVVYYHGGGFVLGGLDSHDDICAELCAGTGFSVISVDYRLAPEHLHPAAFDDAQGRLHLGRGWPIDLPIVLVRRERRRQSARQRSAHATRGHMHGPRSARC